MRLVAHVTLNDTTIKDEEIGRDGGRKETILVSDVQGVTEKRHTVDKP